MTTSNKNTVTGIITILFIILFLYTGISKLTEYASFKEEISTSPFLTSFAKYIALGLPWVEFAVTTLLVVPKWRLSGLYTSLLLMIVFTTYITAILLFNEKLPCSCGGVIQQLSWKQHLVFNSIFILLALTGIFMERNIRRARSKDLNSAYKPA
jgi:uncharacterized membrane protein YphA (DoxX/SURF4 family)